MSLKLTEFTDGEQTYPPRETGVRGQQDGVFTTAHKMAFGGLRPDFSQAERADQQLTYDLVVIGAGISGLAAAHFYRKRFGADKKILLLDCLTDFGGHAKRSEFHLAAEAGTDSTRLLLGYGGSESLQSPQGNFSDTCRALLCNDLGIDLERFETDYFKTATYPALGLSRGVFFAAPATEDTSKLFASTDRLVTGDPTDAVADDLPKELSNARSIAAFINDFPLSTPARQQLLALWTSTTQVTLAEFASDQQRLQYLQTTSYAQFLTDKWGITDAGILAFFAHRTLDFFGMSAEHVPALDACYYGYPGLQGVPAGKIPPNHEAVAEMTERYVHHFPDGNASVARLLVQQLIPQAFPTLNPALPQTQVPAALLLAPCDYATLDNNNSITKIRLASTVCAVAPVTESAHGSNEQQNLVAVAYLSHQEQKLYQVRAKHCVLACFNMLIPYIVRDSVSSGAADKADNTAMAAQAAAQKQNVKAPLVYTNVVLRNWQAWQKLGVHEVYGVNTFHSRFKLDYPVSMGDYHCATDPSEPIIAHLVYVPSVTAAEVADPRAALRAARKKLFALKTADYTAKIRDDLTRLLGPGGFDFDRDVLAIQVCRWSHGYAWVGNTLATQPAQAEEDRKRACAPIANGLITVANSDAGYSAYLHSAVDEAFRAVHELRG